MNRSKESLSGRVAILDITNLSLNEIYNKKTKPFSIDMTSISSKINDFTIDETKAFEYIVRGFFPGLYADSNMNSQIFYSSYLTTYIEKDLRDLIAINDETKFLDFIKILASNTGEELIYDNYAKQVGVVTNTIKVWINILIESGIIYLIHPYNEESIVKRIVKRPKMYFFDTGLACFLCGIDSPKTLQNSFLKGRFFETFIFNEIRKTYINEGIKQELYYYRDSEQNEIDLVLLRNGTISCIEIKVGQTFNASYTKTFKKLANSRYNKGQNAIICSTDKLSAINDGTYILPISSI